MLVLGISGSVNPIHEQLHELQPGVAHDAAAVLLEDGRVVAAIEEERLNRIKHTNKAPVSAIRFCLESYGASLKDIDKLVFYSSEDVVNKVIRTNYVMQPRTEPLTDIRTLIRQVLLDEFGYDVGRDKVCFTPHHMAHALTAYLSSGFDRSLVLTIDGTGGDGIAGLVLNAAGDDLNVLRVIPDLKSLGHFYLRVIGFLGYRFFDEYKVMGLAPYGDPAVYRQLFRSFYRLLPDGDYFIDWPKMAELFKVGPPRLIADPVTQTHKDIAASLQEALEDLAFHTIRHFREVTGHKKLCMAGGVAHNCTLNGKLLYSGLFDDVFIQPAAHDAGCALGAAFHAQQQDKGPVRRYALEHVFWGTEVGADDTIQDVLSDWGDLVEFEKIDNVAERTAELLAQGSVIGWVQGRSEFGPRALGNRSILADPRPAENKEIVNAMVKKREAYRPFAPSVLEERVDEYFDVPPTKKQFPFMTFVINVREDKQDVLRATTHVDGTARIQTVSKKTNPKFWELIRAFGDLTGVYVLLNTSFNNNAEPIVNSAEDAVVCFLTTGLHYLVIGDYLVSKKTADVESYLGLVPVLPRYSRLHQTKRFISPSDLTTVFEVGNSYDSKSRTAISPEAFDLLLRSDEKSTLSELLKENGITNGKTEALVKHIVDLWSKRLIGLRPNRQTQRPAPLLQESN